MKQFELRPSNAHRWINCAGQPAAVEGMLDRPSKYADEGTVAHALLEMTLRLDFDEEDLDAYEGKTFKGLGYTKEDSARLLQIPVSEKMIRSVGHAVDYIRSYCARYPHATYTAEQTLPYTLGQYQSGGTTDVAIRNLPLELVVVDYKNGVVEIEAEENPQLLLYALAVMDEAARAGTKITEKTAVRLVIIQPNSRNVGPIKEHVITLKELFEFRKVAEKAAIAVHKANANRKAGDHCRFCRAAGVCTTYAEGVLQQAGLDFTNLELQHMPDPKNMDQTDIATVLRSMDLLRAWITSVEEEAIADLLNGESIEGFKLVGSRPHRKWDDEQAVIKVFQRAKLDLDLYAPRSPLSPAQLEKKKETKKKPGLPEKLFTKFVTHVTRGIVEPRIAPFDDPRPPFTPGEEFRDGD